MLPVAGRPVIWHVIQRTLRIEKVDEVVVATSTHSSDDELEQWCRKHNVHCFRGDLDDVLARYVSCARHFNAEVVLRITADCPLLDPRISSRVLEEFLSTNVDHAHLAGGFPDGLDTSVFSIEALALADGRARSPAEREHIGLHLDRNPDLFSVLPVRAVEDLGDARWTLDEPADYEFLCSLADHYSGSLVHAGFHELKKLLMSEPDIPMLNSHIPRNAGLERSLKKEGLSGLFD